MNKYYVCHVRGAEYAKLKSLGFLVLYPMIDDYVFLEAIPENKKFLNKQTELGISFLKQREALVLVNKSEIDRMKETSKDSIREGAEIRVIGGYCANLEGRVLQILESGNYLCELQGFKQTYQAEIDPLDLVYKSEPGED